MLPISRSMLGPKTSHISYHAEASAFFRRPSRSVLIEITDCPRVVASRLIADFVPAISRAVQVYAYTVPAPLKESQRSGRCYQHRQESRPVPGCEPLAQNHHARRADKG